ncbi:S2540 protein, partial [Horornis vulcanius]|nr:S2540 protein [Horornis vulcanius]
MSNIDVQKLTIVQQAIASCCGAIITSLFVTPLDVIKTRLQAQSNPFHKALTIFLYTILLGKCFVHSSGPTDHVYVCENGDSKTWYKKPGHFKGTLDAFVKIIRIEGIKALWSGLPPTLHVSFAVGSVTVVSPLELIRTQMQYRRLSYKQLYLCISTKVAVDGWISLWAGWTSTVLRDVPFS